MYEGLILAILLYGSECWVLTERLYDRLRVFHAQCVRLMNRVNRRHTREYHISTRDLEVEMGLESIDVYITRRQLRWLGHVARMPYERLPRRMLSAWVATTRPSGGQLMNYGRTVYKAMAKMNIDAETWPTLADDRSAWRAAIHGALLNSERPKRAAAAETNRRIDASLAEQWLPSATRPRALPPPMPPPPPPPSETTTTRRSTRSRARPSRYVGVYVPAGGRVLQDVTNLPIALQ